MAAPSTQSSSTSTPKKPTNKMNEYEEKEGHETTTGKTKSHVVQYSFDPRSKKLGNGFEETFKTYHKVEIQTNNTEETLNALYHGLKQLGCSTNGTKGYFRTLKQRSESKIRRSILNNNQASSYPYLSQLKKVTSIRTNEQETKDDADEFFQANDSNLRLKLDHDFNKWTQNGSSADDFKQELAKKLNVDVSAIKIKQVTAGSVVVDIAIALHGVVTYLASSPQRIVVPVPGYQMRPNDQIQIRYDNTWYKATVTTANRAYNRNGTDFVVRYNRDRSGSNVFWFDSRNVEIGLNTMRHSTRIRVPGQNYTVTVGPGGAIIHYTHNEPALAQRGNKNNIQPTDHFYADIDGVWYRCQAIESRRTYQGVILKFSRLVDGNKFNWRLWTVSNAKISFNDERQ